MSATVWILVSVSALILVLLGLVIWKMKTKKKNYETDYYSLFTIGSIWTIFGIIFLGMDYEFNVFLGLGLVFLVAGLANKDKWKRKGMFSGTKYEKLILAILLAITVAAVLATFAFRWSFV